MPREKSFAFESPRPASPTRSSTRPIRGSRAERPRLTAQILRLARAEALP